MRHGWAGVISGAMLWCLVIAAPVPAQQRIAGPVPHRVVTAATSATAAPAAASHAAFRRAGTSRLLIGGAIGAALGVLTCNVISEIVAEVESSSHCTAKGNVTFAAGGFLVGLAIAALTD